MPTFRHGRGTKVLMDGWDISTYFRDANVQQSADTAETTSFGSTVKTYVIGMTDGRVALSGMFSGGANEVDELLQAVFGTEQTHILTYAPETLVKGRRVWGLEAHEASYQVSGSVSDLVAVSAEWQGSGGVKSSPSLLDIATAITTTGNETGEDTGLAADTNGGWAILQSIDSTIATSVVYKVQHSTTLGGVYSDLATFTAVTPAMGGGTGKTAQIVRVPRGTTVNQFLRAQYTCTGAGTAHAHIAFMRSSTAEV